MGAFNLSIVHFNDVYHLDPFKTEPVGGYARFHKFVRNFVDNKVAEGEIKPLILFGGDLFNPSLESTVTKGKHMLILNNLGIDVATVGNHDLDFGQATLVKLAGACNFPWLIANVCNKGTTNPIANSKPFVVFTDRPGIRIGVVGLVEEEWLETIAHLPPVDYFNFIEKGRELANLLKDPVGPHKCDIVIAVTHMREGNDILLGEQVPEIDLILGGHDHDWMIHGADLTQQTPKTWTGRVRSLKAGCDFREVALVNLPFETSSDGRPALKSDSITVERVLITSDKPEDEEMVRLVHDATASISARLSKVIGKTDVVLDARSAVCRRYESALGNFIADLMRYAYQAEIGLLAGGTIRSDSLYGPGDISIKDVMEILPFDDPCVVIKIKGKDLLEALEGAVSEVPSLEGRFPQVSGMKLQYDSRKEKGNRVVDVQVRYGGIFEPLDFERTYTVATRSYVAEGHDGYDALTRSQYVVTKEDGMLLSAVVRRFFAGMRIFNLLHTTPSPHSTPIATSPVDARRIAAANKWKRVVHGCFQAKDNRSTAGDSNAKGGYGLAVISPVIEGRVVDLAEPEIPEELKPNRVVAN
ncbi:Metallo-dependent phosphatase-like protein [Cladochytrium replicatum]|nr:Metallo-dependent phosphatase-like protein [Cladochytrium replicatum]